MIIVCNKEKPVTIQLVKNRNVTIKTQLKEKNLLDSITITENGVYYPTEGLDGYNKITVAVPEPVLLDGEFEYNGTYTIEDGDGWSGVTINVSPVVEELTAVENGTYTPNIGVDGFDRVVVAVPEPVLTVETFDRNGNYSVSDGVDGWSGVTVDVKPITEEITITNNGVYTPSEGVDGFDKVTVDYKFNSYYDGSVDVEGLKAIGWTNEDIDDFANNNLHFAYEDDFYKVSDANKALYGVVTMDNLRDYSTNPDMKFVPKMPDGGHTTVSNSQFYNGAFIGVPSFSGKRYSTKPLDGLFQFCTNLLTIPSHFTMVSSINENAGTKTDNMFEHCGSLRLVPLFETSFITSMRYMFRYCRSLQGIPKYNTTNVTDMYGAFQGCTSLIGIPQLSTSNVSNMQVMFSGCTSLESLQLDTSNVTNISDLLNGCTALKSVSLSDTSKCENVNGLFRECSSLEELPFINTANAKSFNSICYYCTNLKSIPDFDYSNAMDFQTAFTGCKALTKIPAINAPNATTFYMAFQGVENATEAGDIYAPNATRFSSCFNNCKNLVNAPNVTTQSATQVDSMFGSCSALTSMPLYDFGKVTYLTAFFGYSSNMPNVTTLGGFKNLKIDWTSYGLNICPNLTYESLMNVINNLYDFRGNGESTTRNIKFHSNARSLLTTDDIAIATAKGWNVQF